MIEYLSVRWKETSNYTQATVKNIQEIEWLRNYYYYYIQNKTIKHSNDIWTIRILALGKCLMLYFVSHY